MLVEASGSITNKSLHLLQLTLEQRKMDLQQTCLRFVKNKIRTKNYQQALNMLILAEYKHSCVTSVKNVTTYTTVTV